MAKAAARENDKITATDTHAVQMGNSVKNETFNFVGPITRDLSSNVKINGRAAAVVGSGAKNSPSHTPSSGSFVNTPTNQGTVATAKQPAPLPPPSPIGLIGSGSRKKPGGSVPGLVTARR
jgi:hypothetical protein